MRVKITHANLAISSPHAALLTRRRPSATWGGASALNLNGAARHDGAQLASEQSTPSDAASK